jgi:hypothetical protein
MKTPDALPLEPAFDWYQFSTKTPIRDLMEVLAPMGLEAPFKQEKTKLKGYGWAYKLGGPGGSVLVQYGGTNGDNHGPNVAGTGPLAPKVAELVRAAGLAHGVGRVDVRLDFIGDYQKCRHAFIQRCDAAGMSPRDNGSCPESVKQLGRSVYGAAPSSAYCPTLYEKGRQMGQGLPVDYLRLEHRFAPTKSAEKAGLSVLTPEQIVGLRPVSRDLSLILTEFAAAPYKLTKNVKDRSPYFWMLNQYQKLLFEMLEDHGSWSAVGQQIGLDLEDPDFLPKEVSTH